MWRDSELHWPSAIGRAPGPGTPVAARIAIVMHDFSSGGTERVAIRLANAWAASGRIVTIFCGTETGPVRSLVSPDVSVVRMDRECVRGPGSRGRLGRALSQFVSERRQDAVFAPGNFHLPVMARFVRTGTSGATTICKLSNPLAPRSRSAAFRATYRFVLRRLAQGVDCFVAMSPALREEARAALGRDDIALAFEPILTDGHAAPACHDEGPARPTIVAAGRLEPQKNFGLALEAFAHSVRARDAQLLLLGEGSLAGALERTARRLGIGDRVIMPGYRASIMADLRSASAFLLTSHYEGYPAVLVEAIAAGAPVIATPCSPAIAEIVAACPASLIVRPTIRDVAAAIDATLAGGRAPHDAGPSPLAEMHTVGGAAMAYLHQIDRAHAGARSRISRGAR